MIYEHALSLLLPVRRWWSGGSLLQLPPTAATLVGAALCFGLRVIGYRCGWHLPVAHPRQES